MSCTARAPFGIIPSPGEAIAAERIAYSTLQVYSSVFMLWDRPLASGVKPVKFTAYKLIFSSKSMSDVLYPTQVTPRHDLMGWVRSGERWEQERAAKTEEKQGG